MATSTIQKTFDLALLHHQAGRLAEAERLYRQILAQQPNHADALHFLGVIAFQARQHAAAAELIRRAIALRPNSPAAYNNLGNVLRESGSKDDAIAAYRKAISLRSDYPDAVNNLSAALMDKGEWDQAIAACRKAIALRPNFAEAFNNLGAALRSAGRLDEAIAAGQKAIALRPAFPQAHNSLGIALKTRGEFANAIAAYRRAIELDPRFADAWYNLGIALGDSGSRDEAIAAYRQAVALRPDYAEAHANLGKVLKDAGQIDEALASCRQAIALRPDFAEAHSNLGNALKEKGQPDQAIVAYRQAIALNPNFADAYNNLGVALMDKEQVDLAIAACRQAIGLKPDLADAYANLGVMLGRIGQLDEALDACRRRVAIQGDHVEGLVNLCSVLRDCGQLDEAIAAIRKALAIKPDSTVAHANLLFSMHYHPGFEPSAIAEAHRDWNRRHAAPLKQFVGPHSNDRNPDRRLRIGYVSSDLREHAVGRFALPLLANHDHGQFEIFAYAQVGVPDAMTEQFRTHVDSWRNLVGMSDPQAADLIRADRIDILVDLTGHTSNNRLLTFARKPAPIQVTYLGYPDTTGLETMDYRLTDAFADPPGQTESYHSEQLIRLSPCAWCFQATKSPPIPPREQGAITFGCFGVRSKITDPMLELWAQILLAVPESRLLLKNGSLGSPVVRQRIAQRLVGLGIDAQRLELRGTEPGYEGHLKLYNRMDIALDTFPYHGTTTTCEAMWMGVPTVSLAGNTHVSRVGVSLLNQVGLAELVADTRERYVQIAVQLAGDLPRLEGLRSTLRHQMEASSLMDAPRFARSVEAAYLQMWRKRTSNPLAP